MNNLILSYNEEKLLTLEERKLYYENLRNILKEGEINEKSIRRYEFLNKALTRKVIDRIKVYPLTVLGLENIPSSPVIYASTHQDFHDHFNVVLSLPEHAIILNTSNVPRLFKLLLNTNGIVYVDRGNEESEFKAKLKLMEYIAKGKSVVVFPEGTYNCSPNKLHLPLHKGVIDIARKMQVPIIPLVQEYTYDENIATIKNVKSCTVKFGKPIYVAEEDERHIKAEELSEQFATIRWEFMLEKETKREEISNLEYINYVLSRIDAWKKVKVNINDERETIYGVDDDFYLFHHINDVAFDREGNLLATPLVQKLEEINNRYLNIGFDRNNDIVLIDDVLKLIRNK